MSRHSIIATLITLGALATGCTAESRGEPSRDEARALASSGKADGSDLCALHGWYDDAVCDEFCERPDPDCEGSCAVDDDCPQPMCAPGGPCPRSRCVEGACGVELVTEERCAEGSRACETCGGAYVCAPDGISCPLVRCDEPLDGGCAPGEQRCDGCFGDVLCAPAEVSCPLVTCVGPGPECAEGERECASCDGELVCVGPDGRCPTPAECEASAACPDGQRACETCGGSFVCAPAAVSCPLVLCDESVCQDSCAYAGDGECDDGGPDSDYSLCPLGTDCADCGPR
ncbi:MAG: hypothetical protein VYE22_03690 [Myxococcota bacterium]|nr:hypothetical protein [Myxococcota bacterium]